MQITNSQSTLPDTGELASTTQQRASIKVLTPIVYWPENQYLTCLWSAVRACGVEVDVFNLGQLVAQAKAGQKVADVIHLNWIHQFCPVSRHRSPKSLLRSFASLLKFAFLKSQGYQLVWIVHNTLSHESKAPQIEHCFRWGLSRLCSDVITMSEYSRQQIAHRYGRTNRVHLVPHGNYIGVYANQISREAAREKLGIPTDKKVLLHLGQLRRYKGVEYLLSTFRNLENPDVILLIAGTCRDAALLEELQTAAQADSRILLHPDFIQDDDIQIYMNACDWVVLPYHQVLNSGSALLALSFGRPIIAPQKGALTELIVDGQHGFSYACDDDLGTTIQQALATSPEIWQQMCVQSYELAQQYDWADIGAQLCKIYQLGA
jgi:glycosyltransferase involved in cell wall biosynthesis